MNIASGFCLTYIWTRHVDIGSDLRLISPPIAGKSMVETMKVKIIK